MRRAAFALALLVVPALWSVDASAGIMGQSEANVLDYFKSRMPGWNYNGKGFKSLEFANKDKNFVIRVYMSPNVVGIQLDTRVETNTPDKYPQTKEGDKVFKKLYHIEDADLKDVLQKLVGASAYKLDPQDSDNYFSKARETTGTMKTPAGSYNVKDFSVMSLPNETIRVRAKFSLGQTF